MEFWNRIFRRDNGIEIKVVCRSDRQPADLKNILVSAAQELLQEQQEEREKRRRTILNDDKLPTYFKNIWRYLKNKADGSTNEYDVAVISYNDVKCKEQDLDAIFSFFTLACRDVGITFSTKKSGDHWVVDCASVRPALTKINQSMDDETRLQLTQGVYR